MTNNKTAVDKIHDRMNPLFKTRVNPNWKTVVEAIGESDQDVADLIQEIRKQFFVATATRPYIDRLGTNFSVSRPKVVGMDDTTFRKYIPILAYQPKQVKKIFDDLLDIFFFREATTAFVETTSFEPFLLKDGWKLQYLLDNTYEESILFNTGAFANIAAATADEVASVINRQAKHSFAVVFSDRVTRSKMVRIFTETIGSKGSVEVTGGRANITFNLSGTIAGAGSGNTTVWTISKVGNMMTFAFSGGGAVNLNLVQAGDVAIIDMPNNSGSFTVENVDLAANTFSFRNLFGTVETFDHGTSPGYYVRFLRPTKSVVFTRENRAVVWEVSPGEIIIEMPATPPVVRRELRGSAHLNGMVATMIARPSDTSITLDDASEWPNAGVVIFSPRQEVVSHIVTGVEDTYITTTIDGRFDVIDHRFSYTGKSGNTLTGISPPLPPPSGVVETAISSAVRVNDHVTVFTSTPNGVTVGGSIHAYNTSTSMDGTYDVIEVISPTSFVYHSLGTDMSASIGNIRFERVGLAAAGSNVYLSSAQINTGIIGPYLWDTQAPFVLSGYTGRLINPINAGTVVLNLLVETPNHIPDQQGYLIFDYGLETQEGPVRYLYKSANSNIALDPAYVFQYDHSATSMVTAIRRRGAQVLGGLGKEYAFYLTDPAAARVVLQGLIADVKSVGVFLNFIIRYPKQYYSDYNVYT